MDLLSIIGGHAIGGFLKRSREWVSARISKASLKRVKIFEPHGERLNSNFHDYFCRILDSANDEILVTGEGFGCATPDGTVAANRYHEATRRALDRGVHVTRIQTGNPLSQPWATRLAELFDEFGNKRFHLYILNNSPAQDIASVSVVDPDKEQCVAEMMLSTDEKIGNITTRLAGTGLFIHGRRSLAGAMRNNIRALETAEIAEKIESSEQILSRFNITNEQKLYFAYGSNMSEVQMRQRCPDAVFLGVHQLSGFELVFNRKGDYRSGGVASVHTSDAGRVYGSLWSLNDKDMSKLDEIEIPTSYQRISVAVQKDGGKETIDCFTYVGLPQAGPITADREYLDLIIAAANGLQIPKDYIRELKAHRA